MKNILIVLVLFSLFNCKTNKYENRLIGDWYDEDNPVNILEFTTDSLWMRLYYHTVHTWNADKTNIYTDNPNNSDIFNIDFQYSLSKKNDTLFLTSIKDTTNSVYKFIRIMDKYKYYNLAMGLNIDLPKTDTVLLPINSNYKIPHLIVNSNSGKLIMKRNDRRLLSLEQISHYVSFLRIRLNEDEFENKFVFNLYADKSVSKEQMDSIKHELKNVGVKRFFRIYRNDSLNYKHDLNWYGIYD